MMEIKIPKDCPLSGSLACMSGASSKVLLMFNSCALAINPRLSYKSISLAWKFEENSVKVITEL